jgi:calcineurin-like phosphoesterase family protein
VSSLDKYYIITDTHFGHDNIRKYCGRPDDCELQMWRSFHKIPDDATLIHLGDVGKTDGEMKEFKFTKILILGNHDEKSFNYYLEQGWDVVVDRLRLHAFQRKIILSHKPEPVPVDYINIHGHFHNTNHRLHEPQYREILTKQHKLLALEYSGYKAYRLSDIFNRLIDSVHHTDYFGKPKE